MDRCVHEISGIVHVASPQSWRSYAIALVFIAGRFVLGVTGWEALGVEIAPGNHLGLPRAVSRVGRCGHPLERNSFRLTVPVKSVVSSNVAKPSLPKNAIGAT